MIILLSPRSYLSAQSIHREQNRYYGEPGIRSAAFYDSLNGYNAASFQKIAEDCQLNRIVFGFHPYWAGSHYLNYQWNLISDFCYFSYEVDPSTGDPVTIYDWLTDPAIDSAQANGVRVHLCATIFSGHSVFFNNPAARQNLIDNLVELVQQRNADGINMDIEAMPSSVSDSMTVFMQGLSLQLKAVLPDAKVSIDLPAVDWGNDFQVSTLSNYIDWFFIMGYDYYWSYSNEAGPVSPLYSLTPGYDFSLARTISAYESAGIDPAKFILGIPYYGRQWKTESGNIPSETISSGLAVTYANVRNNSGTYNSSSYFWEPNSFSSCYIFQQNGSWNQCFIGLDRDLREKYDIVNYRDLAGIGIWALGYDNGYTELWQAIADKFTDCYIPLVYDTIFDSGGPARNYYAGEDYTMTIDHGFNDLRYMTFTSFSLEDGYDSIWIYAGADSNATLLAELTGYEIPATFVSGSGVFTLAFKSDGFQNAAGWQAVFHNGSMGTPEKDDQQGFVNIYPNPAGDRVFARFQEKSRYQTLIVTDILGKPMLAAELNDFSDPDIFTFDVRSWPDGIYILVLTGVDGIAFKRKLCKVTF